ncbi:MAG: divalent-cation tolerance protein CutA [Elusimicrobiota bacterium]
MPSAFQAAFISVPDRRTARALSRGLVRGSLAACVNILPGVRSVYRWKGKVEEARELLLVAKTRSSRSKELIAFVRKNHPYSLPETVFFPLTGGNGKYLEWIEENTKDPKEGPRNGPRRSRGRA